MTLDDYIEIEKERIEKFKLFWIRSNKGYPDGFPMEMNIGDWDEQLSSWDYANECA